MVLYIGGVYQGKLDCAKKRYLLAEEDVFDCGAEGGVEFGKKCLYRLEEFTLRCAKNGENAVEIFKSAKEQWAESVLICADIFCGVVPMGAEMRAWREQTGRLCEYLSENAESVWRVFCGLEQKLK